jgi:heat shock protein HtpX
MLNTLKVGLLLTAMTALFVLLGRAIGGQSGMMMAFGFALLMNVGSYWYSDKIVLSMSGAKPVSPQEAPQLYEMTERLCARAKLPMPKLYVIDDPQPNAFATGRNPQNAAVAVNSGLLRMLDWNEVEGVVAHELAHVKHRDTLTMTIVATLAGAVMMLVQIGQFAAFFGGSRDDEEGGANPIVMLLMMLVAPIAAMMIQTAVSRAREYEADASAAALTGTPHGLMGALAKLELGAERIPPAHANPQTAHMFIVNPLSGMGGMMNLFRTHPPTRDRIARLQQLEVSASQPSFG